MKIKIPNYLTEMYWKIYFMVAKKKNIVWKK